MVDKCKVIFELLSESVVVLDSVGTTDLKSI